jgi:hypothetical protein
MTSWHSQLAWLPTDAPQNPFAFAVLDCRAACAALAEATGPIVGSQGLTAIEDAVRSSQSTPLPTDHLSANCSIRIHLREPPSTLTNFATAEHGGKWIFNMFPPNHVARRRWTGQTIHVAEFELDGDLLTITHVASQRDFVHGSADYAVAEIEFLLRKYLEGAPAAFPIPPRLDEKDKVRIALIGWKAHGAIAEFARILPKAFRRQAF